MNKNKLIILLLFFIFIVGISQVSANDNVHCDATNFTDLNKTIQENTIIELENDIVLTDNEKEEFVNGIFINKNITINGNNHVINGRGLVKIFNINNSTVILNNITLINGFHNENGAAITGSYAKLLINNCIFNNNSARGIYGEGGSINLYNTTVNINNCEFKDNFASDGGAIYLCYCNALIENSHFENNNAEFFGGAIYSNDLIKIVSSEFVNNSAGYHGGAIHLSLAVKSKENIYIENSTAYLNHAKYGGFLSTSSFFGFTLVSNCILYNNYATYGGVLAHFSTTHIDLVKSTIFNNSASYGAVIYSRSNGILNVTKNNIYNNYADKGSIIFSLNEKILVNDSILSNNKLNNSLFYLGNCDFTLSNSSITYNNKEYGDTVIYQFEEGNIYLLKNWWGSVNPNYSVLINASKANIIFDEVDKTTSKTNITLEEGECASCVIQLDENNGIISHRRDGGSPLNLFIIPDEDVIALHKTGYSYFFLSFTSAEGWLVGHGGWDDPNINEKIDALALKMIYNNEISSDYCELIYDLIIKAGRGHLLIKAPNGTFFASCYKDGVGHKEYGVLNPGDYVVCPNGPEYFKIGHLDDISDPVYQSRYLLATDYYGTERHNEMTFYYNNGIVDVYAANDDGSLSNFDDTGADNVWLTDKLIKGADIPAIMDGIYITTHVFFNKTNPSGNDTPSVNPTNNNLGYLTPISNSIGLIMFNSTNSSSYHNIIPNSGTFNDLIYILLFIILILILIIIYKKYNRK